MDSRSVRHVLAAYDWLPSCLGPIQPLGNAGGFSGAELWRIEFPDQWLCLRRWPASHPSRSRLEFIHQVLFHAHRKGFRQFPLPYRTRDQRTFVSYEQRLWELTPWIAGRADFDTIPAGSEQQQRRLRQAMQTLGHFHRATEDFPRADREGPAPGIVRRADLLQQFVQEADQLVFLVQQAADVAPWLEELRASAAQFLRAAIERAPHILPAIQNLRRDLFVLQPCIRDIWHDHVLYDGDRVSGLIDFGALEIDNVSVDIARLLGSLIADEEAFWPLGLASYESVRPLCPGERQSITACDAVNAILSGVQWCRWLYVDGVDFSAANRPPQQLENRVRRLFARMDKPGAGPAISRTL